MREIRKRYVIKYEHHKEVPFTKSRLRRDVDDASGHVIETSLNPFIRGYFLDKDTLEERTILLLDFDELYREASKVVFFTYLTNMQINKDKIVVMQYPWPACILEAEVRFIFDKPTMVRGEVCENRDELAEKMSWTGLNGILRRIYQLSKKVERLGSHLGWLNTIEPSMDLDKYTFLSSEEQKFVELIKQYDLKICSLIKQIF